MDFYLDRGDVHLKRFFWYLFLWLFHNNIDDVFRQLRLCGCLFDVKGLVLLEQTGYPLGQLLTMIYKMLVNHDKENDEGSQEDES